MCVYFKKKGLEKNQKPEDPQTLITSPWTLGWERADLMGRGWRSHRGVTFRESRAAGESAGLLVSAVRRASRALVHSDLPPDRLLWI